jgi:all-trans-retinol 13,14-reductase
LVPAGRERFIDRLCERFPKEQGGIARYFADIEEICDNATFYRCKSQQNKKAVHWFNDPLGSYMRGVFNEPDLVNLLQGQNPLYGVEPNRAPVALHALVTDSFMQNPYVVQGGGDALVEAMVERIKTLGGEVRTRCRVDAIEVDGERAVSGVKTAAGEVLRAPLVVSCAHPKVTLRMLPEDVLRPGYRRRVLNMEDGAAVMSAFMTTKVDLAKYGRRNYYLYRRNSITELYDNVDRDHEFVFVTVPTSHEGPPPDGRHHVIAAGFLDWKRVAPWESTKTGERGPDYDAFKAEQTENLLGLAYEIIPELKGNIETIESATPLTYRDYANSVAGAAYGIRHTVDQSGRYGIRTRTKVSGLYLTGQSVLMPGVCGVTISAFHTCSHILGTEYILGKVNSIG